MLRLELQGKLIHDEKRKNVMTRQPEGPFSFPQIKYDENYWIQEGIQNMLQITLYHRSHSAFS
jgi:hypothetical protein